MVVVSHRSVCSRSVRAYWLLARASLGHWAVVVGVAAPPDLAVRAGLDAEQAELLHGAAEVVEEGGGVGGVALHERLSARVREELLVGAEQAEAALQVDEVHVVELAGRHDVVERRDGGVLEVVPAHGLEPLGVGRVHARVEVLRLAALVAEVVEPVGELLAVGEAQRVGAGQRHQLLHREPLGAEHLDQAVHGVVGVRELHVGRRGRRGQRVPAPQRDGVPGPAGHGHQYARRQRQDVGAGHHAGALQLQGQLGAHHGVEGVAGEGVVDLRVVLRLGELVGCDQHRRVAPAHEAVVEEDAEHARRRRRVRHLLRLDHLRDDPLRARARLAVELRRQRAAHDRLRLPAGHDRWTLAAQERRHLRRHAGREGGGHEEEEGQAHG
jgi:hypothetical protein